MFVAERSVNVVKIVTAVKNVSVIAAKNKDIWVDQSYHVNRVVNQFVIVLSQKGTEEVPFQAWIWDRMNFLR